MLARAFSHVHNLPPRNGGTSIWVFRQNYTSEISHSIVLNLILDSVESIFTLY